MNVFMRFFDTFAAPLFGTDPDGRQVYYPCGAWGSGYIPKDDADAEELRRRVRMSFMVFFVFFLPVFVNIIPLNSPSDIPLLLGVSVLIGLVFNLVLRFYARGLPRSNTRMTFREASARHVTSLGRKGLIAMIILTLPLIGLGVAVLALDEPGMAWLGWFLIAMFGFCLVSFIMKLRTHSRMASNDELN